MIILEYTGHMKYVQLLTISFLTTMSTQLLSAQTDGLCPSPVGEITSHGNGDESWVWHEDLGSIILKGDVQNGNIEPILQGPWATIDFSDQGIGGERWALDLVEDTIVVALRTSESINLQKVNAFTGNLIGESYSVPGSSEGFFSNLVRYDHEKHCVVVKEFDLIRIHDSRTGGLLWNIELSSIPSAFDNVLDYDWDSTHAYVITSQQGSPNKLNKFDLQSGQWSTSIESPLSNLFVTGADANSGVVFSFSNSMFTAHSKTLEEIESVSVSSLHYNSGVSQNVRLQLLGGHVIGVYKQIESFNFGNDSWFYPSGHHLIVIIDPNTLELESTCLLSTPNVTNSPPLNPLFQVNENAIGFVAFEDLDWGSAWVMSLTDQTFGCTDAAACNFSAASVIDDGSCEYIEMDEIQGESYPESFTTEIYTYPASDINSFQWNVINGIIEEGQGTNEVTVYWGIGFGSITLNGTNSEGCSGMADFEVFMLPSDVGEVEHSGFSISPNPASCWIQINGINVETSKFLTIHDLNGRLIVRYDIKTEKALLDVSQLDVGCYLVQLSSGEIQRLVVN
jgi:hypothetical protein